MAEIREVLYQKTKGISISHIARSLDMSRNTIRKYLKIANKHGYGNHLTDTQLEQISVNVEKELYAKDTPPPSFQLIKPLHEQIDLWLQEDYITHTQINRKLKDSGIEVSDRTLNRYIHENFPKQLKATIHIPTKPGEEAQVDYGYVGLMKDKNGNNRKVYAFVMTLSHSRYRYVEFVFSQNQISWAQSHINAFIFFGAVPRRILLDNLKSGVIKADIYDPILNQTYQELSRFYGFVADPAKSAKPEHKGKVEKSVHIVKQQLIAACEYINIAEANKSALDWCQNQISHRVFSTTGKKPVELFEQEDRPAMMALPKSSFDLPEWSFGKVHNDHHIVVKGNFYSVPTAYIGKEVSIRVGIKTVQIYDKYKLIKTHLRNYHKGQWVTDTNDYHESAKLYLDMHPKRCLDKAEAIGIGVSEFIAKTLQDGSRKSLRKAQAVLRLTEQYPESRLEAACLRAVLYDNYEYQTVVNILENKFDRKNTSTFSTKVVDPDRSAYLRSPRDYTSSMEVNL